MRISALCICSPALLFAVLLPTHASALGIGNLSEDQKRAVIVETVGTDSEGEQAGLQEGDSIFGWARDDANGPIESPFDLLSVETEQAPHGVVTLRGWRNSQPYTWNLGQNDWKIQVRPQLPEQIAAKVCRAAWPQDRKKIADPLSAAMT